MLGSAADKRFSLSFWEISVIVRKMAENDLEAVSAICMSSFLGSVADTSSCEGVSTFSKIAASNAFLDRMKGDNLMLVAEDNGKIEGIIEFKEGRHVAMLFINPGRQKEGIGRKLLSAAMNYAKVETVTVRASLSSVPAYEKYGFECKGEASESAGLAYQPMEIKLNQASHGDGSCIAAAPPFRNRTC
ncbi:GNAT family N-acetyltransferase [Denitromonas iodatirespirans]|uniref:GNAT family N-acetyltransferase n=1 Tax=Denitromonas iodatirespirans TaxID=2795389 RepID=A0A944DDA9_DENI1|nr:GNAT family N-acetyltransferase [Denitromonas iodatirespirans]MBT0964115.1 GNAT family N-acetyltransferase [Denitromonas iodatirespirans]